MEKIRFAVAGSGWRARFYLRAAQLLPERFEVTGVLCHSAQGAKALAKETGLRTCTTMNALLADSPAFVVSCVRKAAMPEMVTLLLKAGVPVLSETPLATDISTLRSLDETQRQTGTALELAEQYFLWPTHQARRTLIDRGLLGQVTSCTLSMMHDYHAVSMLRFYLGEENGDVQIRARRVTSPIVKTGDRSGLIAGGPVEEENRVLAQLTYADGRLGLYDFAGAQYHSAIRSSHLRILGTRGEIFDDDVRWVDAQGRPQQDRLQIGRDRMSGTVRTVSFLGERLYENPFRADVTMSEDEIAVCGVLERMDETLRTGVPFYPLAHAFRDAYIACLMTGAADEDGRIHTVAMDWD